MIYRFKLTYSGEDTTVTEPKGWAEFKSEIKRDFKSHGVIFKYTSGTLKLGFTDGRDVLETAFQNDGFDAVVTLTVDQRPDDISSWTEVFTGNAVMKNRELSNDYFSVDFESSTFQQKFINRLDIPVRLDRTTDLDGNILQIGALQTQTDDFDTIRLYRHFFAFAFNDASTDSSVVEFLVSAENTTDEKTLYATIGFGEVKTKSLDGVNGNKTAIKFTTESYNGADRPQPLWIVPTSGETNIDLQIRHNATLQLRSDLTSDMTATATLMLVQRRRNVEIVSHTIFTDTDTSLATTSWNYATTMQEDTLNQDFTTRIGDKFYLIYQFDVDIDDNASGNSYFQANASVTDSVTTVGNSYISFTHLPIQLTKSVKHWLVDEVFQRLIYILTGLNTSFYSDFFGTTNNSYAEDGCGALNTITNGYQLRGIDRPLTISMRDMLDWASARYGIGWGFERATIGANFRIRIELMEHFYKDVEILDLGSPVDIKEGESYTEETFPDLEISSVEVGYDEFFNDVGLNGVFEDFLTNSNYSLPISTIKGKYTKTSPLIASNDIIQAAYDKRDNAESWKYDESNFVIAVARTGADFIQENDENFESIGGLDNQASAYNIRHAPVYMFLDHALLVNSVLFGKPQDSLIQNTSVKINNTFNATFNNYEECLLGDVQRLQRSSESDIAIEDNFAGLRLFKPIQHVFTVAMTSEQLNTIVDAMELNGINNYGYLTYRDNEGTIKTGYPLTIAWNPNDEIAQVTTLEKADNYGV